MVPSVPKIFFPLIAQKMELKEESAPGPVSFSPFPYIWESLDAFIKTEDQTIDTPICINNDYQSGLIDSVGLKTEIISKNDPTLIDMEEIINHNPNFIKLEMDCPVNEKKEKKFGANVENVKDKLSSNNNSSGVCSKEFKDIEKTEISTNTPTDTSVDVIESSSMRAWSFISECRNGLKEEKVEFKVEVDDAIDVETVTEDERNTICKAENVSPKTSPHNEDGTHHPYPS